MEFSKEKNKELCERYPFLLPRNVWTGELLTDYDYEFIEGIGEIPNGWNNLFLQMCEDIRQPLIDANYLDKFRFSQVKEKFATLRCYNFGAPEKVQEIIDNYEYVSGFVCENCGKLAKYETSGWVTNLCEDCAKDEDPKYLHEIKINPIRHTIRYGTAFDGPEDYYYDCSDIFNRLFPGLGLKTNKN